MSGYDLPIQDDNEREWYANVGRIQERERIIKLLEDDYWHHLSYLPRLVTEKPTLAHHVECLGCQLIALIKGEK